MTNPEAATDARRWRRRSLVTWRARWRLSWRPTPKAPERDRDRRGDPLAGRSSRRAAGARRSEPLVDVWRLHWEEDADQRARHPTGRYRFDAPAGEFGVTYAQLRPSGGVRGDLRRGQSRAREVRGRPHAGAGCGQRVRCGCCAWTTWPSRRASASTTGSRPRNPTSAPRRGASPGTRGTHRSTASSSSAARAPHTATSASTSTVALTHSNGSSTERSTISASKTGLRACHRYRITPALYF